MTRQQVREWLDNPVTQMLREVMKERIEEAKEVLVYSDDPSLDPVIKGMARGFEEVLEWEPEVVDAEVQGTESRTPSFD